MNNRSARPHCTSTSDNHTGTLRSDTSTPDGHTARLTRTQHSIAQETRFGSSWVCSHHSTRLPCHRNFPCTSCWPLTSRCSSVRIRPRTARRTQGTRSMIAAAVAVGALRQQISKDGPLERVHVQHITTRHDSDGVKISPRTARTTAAKQDAGQSEFATPEGSKPNRRLGFASDVGDGHHPGVKAEPRDEAAAAIGSDQRPLDATQAVIKAEAQETRQVLTNVLHDIRQPIERGAGG